MNSDQLKKEVHLLEHGFYDEDIVNYINKNLRHFFTEDEIPYISGVRLDVTNDGHHTILPVHSNLAAPIDRLQDIYSVFSAGFLHRIRKTWFKKKYPNEFKEETCTK